jgi:hypothetical protein
MNDELNNVSSGKWKSLKHIKNHLEARLPYYGKIPPTRVEKQNPCSFSSHYVEGIRNFDKGDFIEAVNYFEFALSADPSNRETQDYLVNALKAQVKIMTEENEKLKQQAELSARASEMKKLLDTPEEPMRPLGPMEDLMMPMGLVDENGLLKHLIFMKKVQKRYAQMKLDI